MDDAVIDFVDAVRDVADAEGRRDAAAIGIGKLGFNRFAYRAVRVPYNSDAPFYSTTYPEKWARRYTGQDYGAIDPVVNAAGRSLLPFVWDAGEINTFATKVQRKFLAESAEFGIHSGVTIPIHGRANEFATFSVTTDEKRRDIRKLFAERQNQLLPMALHFHVAANTRSGPKKESAPVRLTPRERECLLWTARGKSAWEVGEILNIAERTVVFHLTNAMHKLDVNSKMYAVVKAIMSGLIFP